MSQRPITPAPDDGRDAYLREALRHAPDANEVAPSALRETILRQARAAAEAAVTLPQPARARAKAPSSGTGWSSLWAWLMRPPVAAGFASMMVATLVGVMWWGRPIDDPLLETRAPTAVQRTPAAPPAAVAQAPAQPTLRDSSEADVAVAAAPKADQRRTAAKEKAASPTPAPRQSTNEALVAKRSAAPEPQAAREERKMAAAAPPAPVAAPAVTDEPAQSSASTELAKARAAVAMSREASVVPGGSPDGATEIAAAVPPAAPSPAERPVVAPATRAAAAAAEASARPARKSEAESIDERSRLSARTQQAEAGTQPPGTQPSGPQPPGAQLAGNARADAAPAQLSATIRSPASLLRAAVAADPAAWTWQRGSGAEQAMTDPLQAWLGQLDDATRSRWQSLLPGTDSGDSRPLRLLRNGQLHSTVRIEPGSVRIEAASGSAPGAAGGTASGASNPPRALLPAAAAAALKTALDQAAP